MSAHAVAAAQLVTIAVVLASVHVPLGSYMARVFAAPTHGRAERWVYRICGVDPESSQRWQSYAASVIAFSVVSLVALWGLLLVQTHLPLSAGRSGMSVDTALNTAVSFVTNTNWQSYAGESGATHLAQMLGLTVQNFVSAAVGLAVAIAVIRGIAARSTGVLGNFWVDLVRGTFRLLLPLSVLGGLLLVLGGVLQNLTEPVTITTLSGGSQTIQGGPVASQEAIKLLGTNGGGFFNANSAHPFENPNPLTNVLEILLVLVIPFSLPRTYGEMVGDRRQGLAVLGFMTTLFVAAWAATYAAERHLAGLTQGAWEGKELRFGVTGTTLFATATTGTSTGAINGLHDSFSPLGGGVVLTNMLLGEVSPGGVGTGLYSALVLAILTVFLAGLMVGRTPELLGKTIGRAEITTVALFIMVMPALVLIGTGCALALPDARASLANSGPHGLTEMMYAYASAANNNGSAFAGLNASTPWFNLTLAFAMLAGRFVPMMLVLALAGSLARQAPRPVTSGTMPTHTPLFVALLIGVAVIVAGLTFFPALALGPIAEATL